MPLQQQKTLFRLGNAVLKKIRMEKILAPPTLDAQGPQRKKSRVEKCISLQATDNVHQFTTLNVQLLSSEVRISSARRSHLDAPVNSFRHLFGLGPSTEIARESGLMLPQAAAWQSSCAWLCIDSTDVRQFFQPFSTASLEWNIMHKTAAYVKETVTTDRRGAPVEEQQATGEMPLNVFEDAEFGMDDDADDDAPNYVGQFDVPPFPSGLECSRAHQCDTNEAHISATTIADELNIVDILKSPHSSTIPTHVDVVGLRNVMWKHTQRLLAPSTAAALGGAHPNELTAKRGESTKVEGGIQLRTFSDIVCAAIPHVPLISANGTLSPAFFFFSILFLANERGIVLEPIEGDLSDFIVGGQSN
jgi:hypothetical protein